jgi:hypothetical protein
MTFTAAEIEKLRGIHVARAWFAEIDLPSGFWRLHNGVGTVTAGGYEWKGISSPVGGQLVSISQVEAPRFGQAAKVDIIISGVTAAFMQSIRDLGTDLEGRSCDLYFMCFDMETEDSNTSLVKLFPGRLSSPSLIREGIGTRLITLSIESPFHAQNFPFGGMWNGASQRRRFPGDKGLDYMGVKFQERIE